MLRTILFFAWLWLSLVVSSPLGLFFLVVRWIGLHKAMQGALRAFVSAWAKSVMAFSGSKISVEGLSLIPADRNLCFVSNHQGDLDIIVMAAILDRPVGFIAKSQAAYLPFINIWTAALGSVFIDRNNIRKAKHSIDKGVRRIREGHALAIYPEGTRSRSHEMGVFRNGSFKLATMADAIIVPITIDGTWKVWEERHRIRPGNITFVIHPPITTAGLSPDERKALPERVRVVIASRL